LGAFQAACAPRDSSTQNWAWFCFNPRKDGNPTPYREAEQQDKLTQVMMALQAETGKGDSWPIIKGARCKHFFTEDLSQTMTEKLKNNLVDW
jgi:hypothetical protein